MIADGACPTHNAPVPVGQYRVQVVENTRLARDTYRVRFWGPELARRIVPGQFVMLRLTGWDDPLLGRPLALYDTVLDDSGQPVGIDIVYLMMGKMTRRLAGWQPGQWLDVWGPLGNGFAPQSVRHLVMVAGGIGQTPFLALAREFLGLRAFGDPPRTTARAERVTLLYGVRSADLLAGVDDFRQLGVDVRISTQDGSAGRTGLVTELLDDLLAAESEASERKDWHVVACGPEKMLHAVASRTLAAQLSCEVSLETPMACGLGICFSCVARIRTPDGGWDYRRTCVEGPVFPADSVLFDE